MGTGYSKPVRHSFLPFYRHPPSSIQLIANEQIVAGIVALLNDYRISQGEPKLGFLKPLLNGIESGQNPGCGTNGSPAIKGWDAVGLTRLVSSYFRRWVTMASRSRVSIS